jgi:hypothetical protein
MITARTDVAGFAGTTRKWSGAALRKWDAPWREEMEDSRFGFATTIRRATGLVSGPTESSSPSFGITTVNDSFRVPDDPAGTLMRRKSAWGYESTVSYAFLSFGLMIFDG